MSDKFGGVVWCSKHATMTTPSRVCPDCEVDQLRAKLEKAEAALKTCRHDVFMEAVKIADGKQVEWSAIAEQFSKDELTTTCAVAAGKAAGASGISIALRKAAEEK